MARMGRFDTRSLRDFQQKLERINQGEVDAFLEDCTKELAARLLRMVIKRTPTGQYPRSTGKNGGTLKRGWSVGNIRKEGNNYIIEIVNPVEYASYVEYGHRTANGSGWVDGRFMMTIAENQIKDVAPQILEKKLKKMLGELLK